MLCQRPPQLAPASPSTPGFQAQYLLSIVLPILSHSVPRLLRSIPAKQILADHKSDIFILLSVIGFTQARALDYISNQSLSVHIRRLISTETKMGWCRRFLMLSSYGSQRPTSLPVTSARSWVKSLVRILSKSSTYLVQSRQILHLPPCIHDIMKSMKQRWSQRSGTKSPVISASHVTMYESMSTSTLLGGITGSDSRHDIPSLQW